MFDPEKGFMYQNPKLEQVLPQIQKLRDLLNECCKFWELDFEKIDWQLHLIRKIFIRIDQRADYYQYLHSKPDYTVIMNEVKRTAVLAYWVLRYKPLITSAKYTDELYEKTYAGINELFAVFIVVAFVTEVSKRPDLESYFDEKGLRDMVYHFSESELSQDGLILYIESLLR